MNGENNHASRSHTNLCQELTLLRSNTMHKLHVHIFYKQFKIENDHYKQLIIGK